MQKSLETQLRELLNNGREIKGALIANAILKDDGLIYHNQVNAGIEFEDLIYATNEIKDNILRRQFTEENPLKIILAHGRCPGDILCITPLVRDIKKQYGERILLMADTPECPEIWDNNPHLTNFNKENVDFVVPCDYGKYGTQKSNSWQYHFYHAFRLFFEDYTGLSVTPTTCYPELFLTVDEKEKTEEIEKLGKYWLIWPGNKEDCQLKVWSRDSWIQLINKNKDITFVQVGQSRNNHRYLEADNVINWIDKTNENIRELFQLMYHAQGSIGYISLQCHLAAAFKKPAIVLAGAREPATFIKYNNQTVLSTQGAVPCASRSACWGGQIEGKNRKLSEVKDICANPMGDIPLCMWLITPDAVSEALMNYRRGEEYGVITNYNDFRLLKEIYANGRIISITEKQENYNIIYKGKVINELLKLNIKEFKSIVEPIIQEEKEMVKRTEQRERELKESGFQPVFRLISNAIYLGGGEKTAIRIMKFMHDIGYRIEFIPSLRGDMSTEFKGELFDSIPESKISILEWQEVDTPCDIFMLHCNDLIWDFSKDAYARFNSLKAGRKIMSINYAIGEIGKAEWTKNFDLYICQSTYLEKELKTKMNKKINTLFLHPPADLEAILNHNYEKRDYTQLRLIRHSSQGMKKYYDNVSETIKNLVMKQKVDLNCRIILMPGLPCKELYILPRVQQYRPGSVNIQNFLEKGNIFWYFVDPKKWRCVGENVVLEAMASGLPVLCNDNYGLKDIVTQGENGWIVKDEDEMYQLLSVLSADEIKAKGQNAKEYVETKVDSEKWISAIVGKTIEEIPCLYGHDAKKEIKLDIPHRETILKEIDRLTSLLEEEKKKEEEKTCIQKSKELPQTLQNNPLKNYEYKEKVLNFEDNLNESAKEWIVIPDIKKPLDEIRVSFVMATYERYELIHRAIRSVLNQVWPYWELIIVSDGEDKLKRDIVFNYQCMYPEKVRYIETRRRRGCWGNYILHDATNFCRGEFIFHLDDDDEASPLLVKELYDKEYDLIWHKVKYMFSGKFLNNENKDLSEGKIGRPSILIRKNFLQKAKPIIKKYIRYKKVDFKTWEYIINNLNPKIKRVNKCYSIAHKSESINNQGLLGFDLEQGKFEYNQGFCKTGKKT